MSTSTSQQANGQQQSAFNALGSYADRIKDANGNPTKPAPTPAPAPAAASASVPSPISSLTPNGDTTKANSRSLSVTPSSSSSTVKPRESKSSSSASSSKPSKSVEQQDGSWETVKSSRQRPRQQEDKEKHGSNSKNWRDRSHREGGGQKQKTGDENEKKGGHGKSNKRHGNNTTATTAVVDNQSTPKAAPTASAPAKPAWGALTQSTKNEATAPNSTEIAKDLTKDNGQQSQTVPPSPSLNGTTITANSVSIPPSIGSPNLSSETASTSTASASVLSKAVDKLEEEGSWRARPKVNTEEVVQPVSQPQPAPPRQAAPPPTVNAWEVRKKTMTPAAVPTNSNIAHQAKPAPSTASKETGQKSLPNGHVKAETTAKPKKKTAARATSSALPPPIHDPTLWPDVSQAAEVVKASEDRKEKTKDKANAEEASAAEESAGNTGTGKKPKWTPIPASELLAAVDQVTENNRRQSRAEANAKKRATASKVENEASGSVVKGGKPKKGAVHPAEGKRGGARSVRAESTSEVKAPSIPSNEQAGSAEVGSDLKIEDSGKVENKKDVVNGEDTTPLTRQISKQSKAGSPKKSDVPISPSAEESASPVRLGSGPIQSRPMTGNNSTPSPQQGFNHHNNGHLPRAPRGRDARSSFNGRGRGGFRSGSGIAHKSHQGFGSPPLGGTSGLPMDGFPNGNAFQRGFGGMGFQSFYPVQGFGQTAAGAGIYDPMQAQYGANAVYRAGLPPPPMPQTVVPNLDATRFYVLGQIEYYFSMQNLAMDFFLRQQMDSEGWIDISMIASFNRVKSLTPDVSIVKDCMTLSSLLEVREDSVRLVGQDASRWVLPDAKISNFGPDPISPSQQQATSTEESSGDITSSSLGLPNSMEHSLTGAGEEQTIRTQQSRLGATALNVENALMKSNNSTITAPIVNGGSEEKRTEVTITDPEEVNVEGDETDEGKAGEEIKA